MTRDDIRCIERSMHELKLGRPEPQTQALVNQTVQLVREIRRLRGLVREAVTCLKRHDSGAASRIDKQIDWKPPGPI